ncbi:hypothetical protein ATANTOWER_007032 [Ataeniobius toweri]|uniref:Uncharacterized protein n=1 Tax=Ataeniobius toweri TaxID=208326 RepID=A0ABU7BH80_9TELE|nr:hypothetical protein [Ataeniobius toweri]
MENQADRMLIGRPRDAQKSHWKVEAVKSIPEQGTYREETNQYSANAQPEPAHQPILYTTHTICLPYF